MTIRPIATALALALSSSLSALANDTMATPEALISCVSEEAVVASCAEPFVCPPEGAFFGRLACAERAAGSVEAAIAHFRGELAPVLGDLDAAEPGGGFGAAEAEAHEAWLNYRNANCRTDRSTALDGIGVDEARLYCMVAHGIQRLAVVRDDLDRFRFKLAASE